MFKKHVYTCPDIIHIRKRNRMLLLAQLAIGGAMLAAGAILTKMNEADAKRVPLINEDDPIV